MAGKSPIEWTDDTWNPGRGCSRVSPGCDNCYAMQIAYRFKGEGLAYEGLATLRNGKPDWTGLVREQLDVLGAPLHWKKPRRIFVNSQTDLFHHGFSNEFIAAVFGIMAVCPQHKFQILTKRAKRMREWFAWAAARKEDAPPWDTLWECALLYLSGHHAKNPEKRIATPDMELYRKRLGDQEEDDVWPLPNVWLGVSAENQETADERLPDLFETPAAVRFVSCEPLLGPIDLRNFLHDSTCMNYRRWKYQWPCTCSEPREEQLDWVIGGGESGVGARVCELEWFESLLLQCKNANVAFFGKQLGRIIGFSEGEHEKDGEGIGWGPYVRFHEDMDLMRTAHHKGGDPAEWPKRLRVRKLPILR